MNRLEHLARLVERLAAHLEEAHDGYSAPAAVRKEAAAIAEALAAESLVAMVRDDVPHPLPDRFVKLCEEGGGEVERLRADVAAVETERGALLAELRCPECGCATSEEADMTECGCDAPRCALPAGKTVAVAYHEARAEVERLREALRRCTRVMRGYRDVEEIGKSPLLDALALLGDA